MSDLTNKFEGNESTSNWIKQRRKYGVDSSLDEKPVLYLSAHRGVFNAAFPGHCEAFGRAMSGHLSEDDKEFVAIDLSSAESAVLLDAIYYFGSHIDKSNTDERLIGNVRAEPLPEYIVNMIYLPPLDVQGNSIGGPSHVWGLDAGNMHVIMPSFADFMTKKGFLKEGQIPTTAKLDREPK